MADPVRLVGQGAFYLALMFVVGLLSAWPSYERLSADHAQIKLAFSHGASRIEECRRLTPAEIALLPPRERRVLDCGRERHPIRIQFEIDGRLIVDRALPPTGLSGDGPARIYEVFEVAAGRHELAVRLDDRGSARDFTYADRREVELAPRQNLTIDFKADRGGFVIE